MTTTGALERKERKPYVLTKSRESWTEEEHEKFVHALQLFARDWKRIEAHIGTKNVIQIRSHAQKWFLKMEKAGVRVPPPRPKRKCPVGAGALPLPAPSAALLASPPPLAARAVKAEQAALCGVPARQEVSRPRARAAAPLDYTQIYLFLSDLMNPQSPPPSELLAVLRRMPELEQETALLLMGNLSRNLTCRAMWEAQTKLVCEGRPSFVTAGGAPGGSSRFAGDGDGLGLTGVMAAPAAGPAHGAYGGLYGAPMHEPTTLFVPLQAVAGRYGGGRGWTGESN